MDPLRNMAEAKIRDAIDDGVFDDLPGKGKPLQIEDDSRVPAELRGAYSVLRSAGMLPEEMELKKSMVTLRELLAIATDGDERARIEAELRDASTRFDVLMQRRRGTGVSYGSYRSAASARLFGRRIL